MRKLDRHLARGGLFPLCKSADGHVNFTRYGQEHYDDCPAGTKTVHRSIEDKGHGTRRYCETFAPVKGVRSIGGATLIINMPFASSTANAFGEGSNSVCRHDGKSRAIWNTSSGVKHSASGGDPWMLFRF